MKANAKVREWLAKGTVVYGYGAYPEDNPPHGYLCNEWRMEKEDHNVQAILVQVRPIEPEDSAEALLKKMLELEQSVTWRMPDRLIERARKLIGAKK